MVIISDTLFALYCSISDIAQVDLTAFSSDPVVEGYSTEWTCSLREGYPPDIDGTDWKIGSDDVDIGKYLDTLFCTVV